VGNRLYHVSEEAGIERFVPRPARAEVGVEGSVVWAVDEEHLHNYLLPRDCPRVTYYALPESDPADVERLLGQTSARFVVAVESLWLSRIQSARLYLYELPPATFVPLDPGAGYHVSLEPVNPSGVVEVPDALAALLERDVELRVMPSLWRLRDLVVASSLQFSCIRMRNALPRE
jgi:hypothetical protein